MSFKDFTKDKFIRKIRVSSTGEITISVPKKFQRILDIGPGDKIQYKDKNGRVYIEKAKGDV